jgi:hypothetical protein
MAETEREAIWRVHGRGGMTAEEVAAARLATENEWRRRHKLDPNPQLGGRYLRTLLVSPKEAEPLVGKLEVVTVNTRYTRQVGEQPEPAPVSVVGCPYCQRVPCEAPVAHGNWRRGVSGSDV